MNGRPNYETWNDDQWRELFERVVEKTVIDEENAKDIVAGAWFLGKERAKAVEQVFQPAFDVPYALSLFCWWPLKYQALSDSWEFLSNRRWNLFQGARVNPSQVETQLLRVVPRNVLTLDHHQLLGLLRVVHIRHILKFDEDADSSPKEASANANRF